MKRLFCLAVLATLIAGCDFESRRSQLEEIGLLKEQSLHRIEHIVKAEGSMEGPFFLGIGSVPGKITVKDNLRFYWGRTDEERIATTLPYTHFRFIIDDSKEVPTVQFILDNSWLVTKTQRYSDSDKSNLNTFLSDGMIENDLFKVAIVRISRKDLEKEVYLPQ